MSTDVVTGAATAAHDPKSPLEIIGTIRILPVLVVDDPAAAVPLARALVDAGLPCAEVTLRTDSAFEVIRAMSAVKGFSLGAGTVLDVAQAQKAISAGARYVVTPGFSPSVVSVCLEARVPVIPGVATATEVQMALDAGLTLVKLFPAESVGGLATVKALRAPFPMVQFVPTGGINLQNFERYLEQRNVFAVGGSWIAPRELVRDGGFDEITRRARDAMTRVLGSTAHARPERTYP